eukprot:m.117183 g.117183  ORF g.117183 m.117183 type:complete len:299 (+) comp21679_c1_seq1:137-1033(+)
MIARTPTRMWSWAVVVGVVAVATHQAHSKFVVTQSPGNDTREKAWAPATSLFGLGSIWLMPSGLPMGAAAWRAIKGNTFWANDTWWSQYLTVRDADAEQLQASLGGKGNATAIIYFEQYLADAAGRNSTAPLDRLDQVVAHFASHGIRSALFLGDPEFTAAATWESSHDVVRNATARAYLKRNIAAVLQLPNVKAHATYFSVYWLGASNRCAAPTDPCTETMISEFLQDVGGVGNVAGGGLPFVAHVDGPFWGGCPTVPCPSWYGTSALPVHHTHRHPPWQSCFAFFGGAHPRFMLPN